MFNCFVHLTYHPLIGVLGIHHWLTSSSTVEKNSDDLSLSLSVWVSRQNEIFVTYQRNQGTEKMGAELTEGVIYNSF